MNECPYCKNSFEMTDTCHDEFKMWQGLVGPYYIPTIDEDGNLSWTNTGDLPNPNPINIIGPQGNGLYIGGIVETVGELPASAEGGVTWLVGDDSPYEGYVFLNGSWTDIGEVLLGPAGPAGPAGPGVPTGGTTGQVLQKASNSDYVTQWADAGSGGDPPATADPLMDGTAAVGTAHSYAREDHVHPSDTSRQPTLVSGTNIKTVNGQSLLGSGNLAAIPTGGAAGDVLVKNSASNYDAVWGSAPGGGALYFQYVPVAAGTGDIATVTNAAITADFVVVSVVWTDPSAITSDVSWATANGSLVLNGTCATATTCDIVLVQKNN